MTVPSIKEELESYTGKPRRKAVFTITLAELIDADVFNWSKDYLDWSSAAYNSEQYERVCNYFIERFKYREISMKPFQLWAQRLHMKLVYEVMPKYKALYKAVENGLDPIASDDEVYKERRMRSDFPQTQLGGNQDYVTSGDDTEFERLHYADPITTLQNFAAGYHAVDEMLLDELECMFIGIYNANSNLW